MKRGNPRWRRRLSKSWGFRLGILFLACTAILGIFAEMLVAESPWLCIDRGKVVVFPARGSAARAPLSREKTCFEPLFLVASSQEADAQQAPVAGRVDASIKHSPGIVVRLVYGARATLGFAALVLALSLLAGLIMGWAAGHWGGVWEHLLARPLELIEAFPVVVVLAMVFAVAPQNGTLALVVSASLIRFAEVARLVRAELLRIDRAPFVVAARAIGCSRVRLLQRHILPNITGPLSVHVFSGMATLILLEVAAAYLELGPGISWGGLLAEGVRRGDGSMVWSAVGAIGATLGACYVATAAVTEAVYEHEPARATTSSS